MRSVSSTFFTIALSVLIVFASPLVASAATLSQPAVLPGLSGVFTGDHPDNIGVIDGKLADCPTTPNCVVSQNADEEHAIAPIIYKGEREAAKANIVDILGVVPRTKIVEETDNYILAESESRLMGFVDDTEFYFPADKNVIQVRAAARMGESDLGVNRRRVEQIRLAFNDLAQQGAD
ncbi:conserved hypothetical protein [Synechococcus sp. PCC 7335]|nr:conserved hypothetical protein [Synechococcus sp. PCC 7335]